MRAQDFINEASIGVNPKRPPRPGSRPSRGHDSEPRYKATQINSEEAFCEECGGSLSEAGKASRELCISRKPDDELGASNLASCKSQGLRARDGNKSHLIGHGKSKHRIKVGGKKIKGKKYGGPLPDYGTRPDQ